MHNIAYIDGQNLYLGTTSQKPSWEIDLVRFRVYLTEKYNIDTAYYYLGYPDARYNDVYEEIQTAGFVLQFRDHTPNSLSAKKGNVDTEIIFDVMHALYKNILDGIVLVSGDGDYAKMIHFLQKESKLIKVLFPHQQRASALYRYVPANYFVDLSRVDMRNKLGKKEKAG
jgi:uncharacterized LabA/DUF88 family protein